MFLQEYGTNEKIWVTHEDSNLRNFLFRRRIGTLSLSYRLFIGFIGNKR